MITTLTLSLSVRDLVNQFTQSLVSVTHPVTDWVSDSVSVTHPVTDWGTQSASLTQSLTEWLSQLAHSLSSELVTHYNWVTQFTHSVSQCGMGVTQTLARPPRNNRPVTQLATWCLLEIYISVISGRVLPRSQMNCSPKLSNSAVSLNSVTGSHICTKNQFTWQNWSDNRAVVSIWSQNQWETGGRVSGKSKHLGQT